MRDFDPVDQDLYQGETMPEDKYSPPQTRGVGCVAFTFGMVDRCYGGPEEGGWWYDRFEPLRFWWVPARSADRFERHVRAHVAKLNRGRREISSVLSEGRYALRHGHETATRRPPNAHTTNRRH